MFQFLDPFNEPKRHFSQNANRPERNRFYFCTWKWKQPPESWNQALRKHRICFSVAFSCFLARLQCRQILCRFAATSRKLKTKTIFFSFISREKQRKYPSFFSFIICSISKNEKSWECERLTIIRITIPTTSADLM